MVAAEFAGAIDEKRDGGLVDGVGVVRVLAYYEYAFPKLALCDPGVDCRVVLWMDLAQDGVYLCFGNGARAGRCDLALPVSDFVKERKCWLTISTPPPSFFRKCGF